MAARDPGELCAGNKNPPDCFLRTQFSSGDLPVGFEIRDGLGSYSLMQPPGRLRYQVSGTREKQAGDGDTPGFEYHGYAVLPSKKISEAFRGRQWALETRVTYHFPPNEHGREIGLSIVFEKKQDGRTKRGVIISRYADGISGANDLRVGILDGRFGESHPIRLSDTATYYFKIIRQSNNLAVYVSNGDHYHPIVSLYKFANGLGDEQALTINSFVAEAQDTYADVELISLQGINLSNAVAAAVPAGSLCHLAEKGAKDTPATVKAEDVVTAVQRGCDIDLDNVVIVGPLYLNEVRTEPLHPGLGGDKNEAFLGELRNDNAENNVRYVAGRFHLENCRLPLLAVPSYTIFLQSVQISHCEIGSLMMSKAVFSKRVDLSYSTVANLSITYSFFSPEADADFSFLQCSDKIVNRDAGAEGHFRYADFRGTRFGTWTSFYGAHFLDGASFTDAHFLGNVSFSGISLGDGTISFRQAEMLGRFYLVSSLERPIHCGSGDVDMSQARISELIIRTDEQQWTCTSRVVLTLAKIRCLLVSHVTFESTLDLSGATFSPSEMNDSECSSNTSIKFEAVRFKDNSDLRVVEWPATKTLLSQPMYVQLQSMFQQLGDTRNERLVFFDGLSQPKESLREPWYARWLWRTRRASFAVLWMTTAYFTSVVRLLITGFIVSLGFALALTYFEPLPLRCIHHRLRLHLRLAEAPILSSDDKDIGPAYDRSSVSPNNSGAFKGAVICFFRKLWLAFRFSCVNFAKIGFGGLRVDPGFANWDSRSGRMLLILVWSEWMLGYLWYFLLIYTLAAAIPAPGAMLK
jgi:uncharacterized protein YjbI with pentapeptide repeats